MEAGRKGREGREWKAGRKGEVGKEEGRGREGAREGTRARATE